MRAKLVYEKFEEGGDPIKNMGVGLKGIYQNLKPGDEFRLKKSLPRIGKRFKKGSIIRITDVVNYPTNEWDKNISFNFIEKPKGAITFYADMSSNWGWNFEFFKEYLEPVYLKESLNERFTDESDPIRDMGIGDKGTIIKRELEKLALENGFRSDEKSGYVEAEDIEGYGWKNVKIIESWYKEGEENFREITLYSYDDRETGEKRYGIFECEEEAESGGDELSWPDGIEFTDDYWKRNIN